MNTLRIAALALLLQSAPEQRLASIEGVVVKAGTGEALSKITVALLAAQGATAQSYTVTTAADGKFVFREVQPGPYQLVAARSGYVRAEYGQRGPNGRGIVIALAAGQQMKDIQLSMTVTSAIYGRVYDRDGEAVGNASVQALRFAYQEGRRVLTPVQSVRTNDLGEYRLFWLPAGRYFVSATPMPAAVTSPAPGLESEAIKIGGGVSVNTARISESASYVPVYFPGTIDPAAAAPIDLSAVANFGGVDIIVEPMRTRRIRGAVLGGGAGPSNRATISLVPWSMAPVVSTPVSVTAESNGSFDLRGVVPGSYYLMATAGTGEGRLTGRVPIGIGDADLENVIITLTPGLTIVGRIAVEGGLPNNNDPEIERLRINLRPDPLIPTVASPTFVMTAEGSFVLQGVAPGNYRVTVAPLPQNGYLKRVRTGNMDVLNGGLHLDGPLNAQLEIVIGIGTGTVDGLVLNDRQEPAANITVALVPDTARRQRTDLYRSGSTDAQGRFQLQGVPPGDYKVFAGEDAEIGAWQDPEFIRLYEDRGKLIQISEGSKASVDVPIISARP